MHGAAQKSRQSSGLIIVQVDGNDGAFEVIDLKARAIIEGIEKELNYSGRPSSAIEKLKHV